MARGGYRPGAGRKPNPDKLAREKAQREAIASGKLPSVIMLENARILQGMAARYQPKPDESYDEASAKLFIECLRASTQAAASCGAFYEPRIAQVHVVKRADLGKLSDDELTRLEAIILRASESGGDPAGEGPTLN